MSIISQRFGRLVVQGELGRSNDGRKIWACLCDCGQTTMVSTRNLNLGRTISCGCARAEHGKSKTQVYKVWASMRERCSNPKQKNYAAYGGRGIKVDPRWERFEQFVADMGERPKGHSLDRIDNDGDYSPENCRWTTQKEQVLNSSRPRWITVKGVTKHLSEWARDLKVPPATITNRINAYGWSEEEACTTPPQPGRKGKTKQSNST